MAYSWPKEPKVVGTKVNRVDGADKITGRAKYSQDINRPGMLYGVLLPSSHAHAILEKVDTARAEKMVGVKGIHRIKKDGAELVYAGDPILALAAETEDQAYDALAAIDVGYKILQHSVKEMFTKENDDVLKVTLADKDSFKGGTTKKGDFEAAYQKSAARIERRYGMPAISHCCLESHGGVAEWDGDYLTVWLSTQGTQGAAKQFAKIFKVPETNVNVITHVMGGGYGSKFQIGEEGAAVGHLAKITGRPVKLMLDRKEEHSAGIRPPAWTNIKAGAQKDGSIVAFYSRFESSKGVGAGNRLSLPYVYEDIPNLDTAGMTYRINQFTSRAYRAPNHPQACFIMEQAVDDLAAQLGMDPLELRLRNLKLVKDDLIREIYKREIQIGAKLIDWKQKWQTPGSGKGPIKRGVGMGCHKWGGRGRPNTQMTVEINADGSVLVQSSTQDLGTANRTVLAIVAAEVLGLKPEQINTQVGESQWANSSPSGGSTTCPSTAPTTLIAATDARDKLFEKIAPAFGANPKDLVAQDGKISVKGGGKSMTWGDAVRKLGLEKVSVMGEFTREIFERDGLSSVNVGGCQFAEVEVDEETGQVRLIEVVAVQDCGLIINSLCCESQVAGGVIMALNAALFEERVMDQATGRLLNADLEFYKLGMISDMPKITVHLFDDPISQSRGVIGVGEPPTISTAAAIANAVHNALGVRVPYSPLTPPNVLAAIEESKGGAA